MKDQIRSYLNDYIEGTVDPGTAVLITGPWGCGKTRFIQDYLGLPRDDSASSPQPNSGGKGKTSNTPKTGLAHDTKSKQHPKALVASFFGAQTQMDILSQFAAQSHPLLTSRPMQAFGSLMMLAARYADDKLTNGLVLSGDEGNGLIQWLGSPGKHVLVFDDLERSSMPMVERLATINRYVESMGLKVIVIANEDEIPKDEEFDRWKEKVIGKTLRVDADPRDVMQELALALTDDALKQCIIENIDTLSNVLAQLDDVNYRSVRSLVFDVQRLVSAAPQLRRSSEAMLSILTFSLAVGSLIRSAIIEQSEVNLTELTRKANSDTRNDERFAYLSELHGRFSMAGAMKPIISPDVMARLWCDGEIDEAYLKQITSTHHLIVGDDAQPAWQWLREPEQLSVTRYQKQKETLLKCINSGEILDPGVLLHVIDVHLHLETLNAPLFDPGTDPVAWTESYLERHDVNGLEAGQELSTHQHAGYRYRSSSDVFHQCADVIRKYIEQKDAHRLHDMKASWLKEIKEGRLGSLSFDVDHQPGRRPWLHLTDPHEVASILLQDGFVYKRATQALEARYGHDGQGQLEEEWAWLERLQHALDSETRRLEPPHLDMASKALSATFSYIKKQLVFGEQHLERTRDFAARVQAELISSP